MMDIAGYIDTVTIRFIQHPKRENLEQESELMTDKSISRLSLKPKSSASETGERVSFAEELGDFSSVHQR